MSQKLMHIHLTKEQGAKYVFVPGSPDRVKRIAEKLDNPKFLAQNREYTSYEGYIEGEKVLVTSTGIGGPSAVIAMEELAQIGVDTFVRIGTCASLSEHINIGDIVIPNGVVRMEGTSTHYLPMEFPAVPNYELMKNLEIGAKNLGHKPRVSVNITKASFYTQTEPLTRPNGKWLKETWDTYVRGGAESTSMESAPLFICASSLGLRMATILISATSLATSTTTNHYSLDIESVVIDAGIEGMRQQILEDRKNK